jgi:hypothetical protein
MPAISMGVQLYEPKNCEYVDTHFFSACKQFFRAFHLKISQSELIVLSVGPYDEVARYNLLAL